MIRKGKPGIGTIKPSPKATVVLNDTCGICGGDAGICDGC